MPDSWSLVRPWPPRPMLVRCVFEEGLLRACKLGVSSVLATKGHVSSLLGRGEAITCLLVGC